jgi:hypothetical protein
MTSTQPGTRAGSTTNTKKNVRTAQPVRELRETKPSFMTTEFWAMLAGIAAIVVIYNAAADASLTLFRACLLATIIGTGYIVSRGIAKAGSHDDDWNDRYADHR